MKKFPYLLIALTALSITSCGTNNGDTSSKKESKEEKPTSEQVLLDNTFQHGIKMDPGNGLQQDTGWTPDEHWPGTVDLVWGQKEKISWLGAQHGDVYSLNDKYNKVVNEQPEIENGTYTFFDESKKIAATPSEGKIYLELNTSKEYIRPRRSGEQWCHLLMQQGFTKAVRLQDCNTVDFTIDLDMKKCEDHMNGQANPSDHTIQFLMYLVVKSENTAETDGFFWFGIPFFDYRYKAGLAENGLIDAGGAGATSKFIYGMDTTDYLPDGMYLNGKQSVDMDIKPAIARALNMAQTRFNRFTHSTIDDLTFQSMNIGFEIPGTYDCGIEISNFSLTANYAE